MTMNGPSITPHVPEPLADRIRVWFEKWAQRQAAAHRAAGLHTYKENWHARPGATWIKPDLDPNYPGIVADLHAAGFDLLGDQTVTGLVSLSLMDRVDEILANG